MYTTFHRLGSQWYRFEISKDLKQVIKNPVNEEEVDFSKDDFHNRVTPHPLQKKIERAIYKQCS